ncbi:MAG: 30S ribosomal protein S19e [DPANN group archaeon]|nr:30S ribosomal protein S19e [DPANN group archaeon]
MVSLFDVSPQVLAKETATELKGKFEAPSWASIVKTGANKERPPLQSDWWHLRAASILRTIYKDGPVGVSKLRSRYGSRKNRGVKPHKFTKASGNIIRKILQQLEKTGLVQQKKIGVHKGRIITPAGASLLSRAASKVK